jgi:hypothetical protein
MPLAGQTGLVAEWRGDVDTWWAGVLGVPLAAIRGGGAHAASLDHVGIVAIAGAAAPLGYGPAGMVVQYRAWRTNTASISVARRSGFTHYCDALVIELSRPSETR